MDDFKEKSKRETYQSTIDFVVPMQLEECIYWMRHNTNPLDLKVDFGRGDRARFTAVLKNEEEVIAKAKGIMRRWQGTSTRIKYTIDLLSQNSPRENYIVLSLAVFVILMAAILLGSQFIPFFIVTTVMITALDIHGLLRDYLVRSLIRNRFTRLMKKALQS
jgi:hypothetical protein